MGFEDDEAAPRCEMCEIPLELIPDTAGEHLAVRLDCIVHGPQLMWMPFGDDAAK
ncbi:hypothetical protein ACFWN7_01830 [Agromyces sp. NPDC058484]|uniref:hypothetical protein n=1 Tax=Agromyces sp. NPDC058484 TaxID=3346524 RepID=UPI0036621C6B